MFRLTIKHKKSAVVIEGKPPTNVQRSAPRPQWSKFIYIERESRDGVRLPNGCAPESQDVMAAFCQPALSYLDSQWLTAFAKRLGR
jgi:hypothetical protein